MTMVGRRFMVWSAPLMRNPCASRVRRAGASLAAANSNPNWEGYRMTRIAIIDRADMNAEQARVYDTAKQTSGIVGGPYLAYIRLPKLFEASQTLRATLASGPLSPREQQIVNLSVARHLTARYPSSPPPPTPLSTAT